MSRLGTRVKRFLQRPGTADISSYQRLLPTVAAREDELRDAADSELRELAAEASGHAGFCAVGREAARRALGERPYDVQLLGTLVMLDGHVAEMATGEGKTLSGALTAAGYAVGGRSVHVMSVNDYLARRDAEWMRPVYDLLGVTVGYVTQDSTPEERRDAYAAQVTYGSVSEIGFDVLRDRLQTDPADMVMREPDVVVIDEADSVLIDEALVPLVLAGAAQEGEADVQIAEVVRSLRPRLHYDVDTEERNVHLTDAGARAVERALGGVDIYAEDQVETLTRLNVALHAQVLLRRDVDYIVKDGKVGLVSASRGRVAKRQRWPDGLQAAVEAKEALEASPTGEVLDSITVESLVRRYPRVCGMTATAVTVGEQLREFYELEVAVVPPNRPCVREDEPDRLYTTVAGKEDAVVSEVAAAHATGRPVLIGTLSVAESQRLADRLAPAGVACQVLNAKNDAEEAAIIAEAGAASAVTVLTQMAGRGTDIRLGGSGGGSSEVAELGGLYVIGTGRYWSARLDGQLRGRSGRQGDPGTSVLFVSLEDELVTQCPPGVDPPVEVDEDGRVHDESARWYVDHAQRVAEGANLEVHRNTFRYNKLIEEQRDIVLGHRDRVLRTDVALSALARRCPERHRELASSVDNDVLVQAARMTVLYHLDRGWADHLAELAHIREGIHLRALGRGLNPFGAALNPLSEFYAEAASLFSQLLARVEDSSAETFEQVAITGEGADLDALGLKRPTATWTYLVRDNPFGTVADVALRRLSRLLYKTS